MAEPRIASIVRYPVKGLPGVVAEGDVALRPGSGLRWDRSHAIENGRVRVESPAAWNSREAYFHVARYEEIVRFGVALDAAEGDAPVLTLTAPDGRSASAPVDEATDHAFAVTALLRGALDAGPAGPVRLIRTGVAGLWDWPDAHLSFINLATVAALEGEAGATVDPRRFRGNVLLEGLPAWGELDLLGRRVRVGDAVLEFFQPTDRCRATTIDPVAGVSNLNVPALLASRYGHMYCGVYARVVSGGTVRAGDALEVVGDTEVLEDTTSTPSILDGEPGWPRTGRVVEREQSGARSVSYWVADPTGLLGDARPGQHLRVHLAGEDAPNWRSYTISATAPGRARITVRRDGRISSAMHERLERGDPLVITGPFGDVTLDRADERDVVLVSAGSGITPTAAMLRGLADARSSRRVRVLHVERTAADLALWEEVAESCSRLADASLGLHLTRAAATAAPDASYVDARTGRPTARDVLATIEGLDPAAVDAFVCGPALFTAEVRSALTGAGVPARHVHAEVFYSPTTAELTAPREPSTTGPHRVRAGTAETQWRPRSGSILDAMEGVGQDWPSGCRVGACGTCVRGLRSGTVEYLVDPLVPPPVGSVLVCCSAPTSDVELDA
ncbi:MOSC domain-containing protein [Labedella phragmitis]|uniref:MOSC domain-containing protein n=1 Tax=Labedella phragmitis TaxID=2498849 RepID=A0A444PYL4_9MICO|nr:MOSC domain-containing protein [Labedella phragmitis]RWZ53009.1 MOSC domain-containing protein [Labedella phragmitis]